MYIYTKYIYIVRVMFLLKMAFYHMAILLE